RLRQKYNLTLQDGLAESLADELLFDPESPVAPTLQILLTKLWNHKKRTDSGWLIDREVYEKFRRQGLADFLNEQLQALRESLREAEESGLVLDLLNSHTTPYSTGDTRSYDEIEQQYGTSGLRLVRSLKTVFLLTDPADDAAPEGVSRL